MTTAVRATQPTTCACHASAHLAPLVDHRPVAPGPRHRVARTHRRQGPADLLLVGHFRTMNSLQPTAESIAVRDGVIIGLGNRSDVDALTGPGTRTLDLGDGIAYPGFVEPHMHYWASATQDSWVDCTPLGGASFDEIVDKIRQAAPTLGDWTLGTRYDPSLVPGERELTRDVLDAAVPDRPVLVMNASLHYAYANSKALELAGIDEDTPDPGNGGHFVRENGRLTGALGELPAISAVVGILPRRSQEDLLAGVVAISERAASRGVVRTHDAGTGMMLGAAEIDLFHAVSDRLDARVSFAIYDTLLETLAEQGLVAGAGDDKVRAVSLKLISDGSNQGRSGYQRDNYLGRDDRGRPNVTTDYMADRIRLAHEHGWQVMVHANGDAAISSVVDAFAQVLEPGGGLHLRDRIEHCSFAHDDDLARMARLGLSPSFLMNHVYHWGRAFADNIVGPAKAAGLDPVASALEHGLRPSFHSDYAVTDIDPLRCVQTAVTRRVQDGGAVLNAGECVTVAQAMAAVTSDAAWQIHADDTNGTLEVGKFADIAVLSDDPMTVDPDGIAEIEVLRTMLGGEITFSR